MSTAVGLVAGCAVVTAAVRIVGPVAFGGRPLPDRFTGMVVMLAPALLAALVITQALADGERIAAEADTAGVVAGGVVAWRTKSAVGAVIVAAAVTAVLRQIAR